MVKEKPNQIRTYDCEGFRRRASCLCFRDSSEREVLLISSSRHREKWVVPGGGIEPKEDARKAAEREAQEEAGVKGQTKRYIGTFENKEKKHRTLVFSFVVGEMLEDWEDKKIGRTRKWFTVEEGMEQLRTHKPIQVGYLEKAAKLKLENG